MNKPEDPKDSFYIGGETGTGKILVTLRDSVFQASDVFDHMAQLCESVKHEVDISGLYLDPVKLSIQADGGPDRNLCFLRTKLALLAAFKTLNLDILIATRCAPGQSYLNVAERAMLLLNIGLQHVSIQMGDMPEWLHELLDKCPSMAETRTHCSKLISDVELLLEQRSRCSSSTSDQPSSIVSNWEPGMRLASLSTSDLRQRLTVYDEYKKAAQVPIGFLEERFARLKAGGRSVEIKKPVTNDKVDLLHNVLRTFDATYDEKLRKSTDLKKMPTIDRFFQCSSHVLESPYCLQIRRCGKNCEFGCGAFRTPAYLLPDSDKTLQQIITEFMPLPMRDDSEKTQEKYFQCTAAQDASYRSVQSIPSLQNKTDKSAITNAKKKLDTERGAKVNKWNRNSVRLTVSRGECGKKRCIFSKLSQSDEVKGQLGSFLEDMEYFICGDSLFVEAEDGAHPLSLIFFNRINLTCADHTWNQSIITLRI